MNFQVEIGVNVNTCISRELKVKKIYVYLRESGEETDKHTESLH